MRAVQALTAGIRAGAALPPIPVAATTLPRQVDPATVEVVNRLFVELQAIFPAWRQAWPDDKALAAAKRSWIKGFAAAGITSLEQIRFGLEQCRLYGGDFIPSVGKFIVWCRPTPESLGLPTPARAFREACRNAHPAAAARWSHEAVHHAACETGFHELRSLPEDRSRVLFERAYAVTVRMLLAGEPLREIPKALPASVSVSTPEVGKAALSALRRQVRGGVAV